MNILVVLRAVQDPAGITVNRKAQKVFINRPQAVVNPADRNALEAGLRLDGALTAVAFGAGPAEEALRDARALGARRALRLADPAWEAADAYVLAADYGSAPGAGGAATVVRITGGGHIPRIEPPPVSDEFRDAVLTFLEP